MIKKYVSKFTIDILPSIIATIVGAYIVTHYINPKPDGGKPAAALAPDAGIDSKAAVASPADRSPDLADAPAVAAPRAKVEKASTDKPDAASAPEPRRHQPAPREKAAAKAPPVVVAPVATASVAPVEVAPTPDERRDANDLARAAIERLRGANDAPPRPQEAARAPETVRTPEPPRVAAVPSIQPLPPAIMVSNPPAETYSGQGAAASRPSYATSESITDPRRPRPPGDIPQAVPLDIQADATASTRRDRTSVAEDVLSAAKSVLHALPRPFER